jgi:hypothetical protein
MLACALIFNRKAFHLQIRLCVSARLALLVVVASCATMRGMRYATAVRRLRQIAEDAHRVRLPGEEPLVAAIYTFGTILEAPDAPDGVDIALVANEPAEELTWGTEPPWTIGIVERLRLDKAPVRWFFRPAVWPVWNHHIREPLRIYSAADGPDAGALYALAHGDAEHLRLPAPSAAERREQAEIELDAAHHHLRAVHEPYWDRDCRREHKGFGIYPDTHLWNAVWGYLDLQDATHQHGQ